MWLRQRGPLSLAGIDEGDKIRTIYDGSVGGANDTIRNQTVERTTAPTVLEGVQALHWLHAAAEEGPPSQGSSNLYLGAGSGRSRALLLKAKAHHKIKKSSGTTGGSRWPQWGKNKVGTYGMASAQSYWGRLAALLLRSSTRFSLKWIGTSSSSTTSCGCFEARGQ